MAYRLGLDLGTNSIGWCAVNLDADGRPVGVLDAGVRILSPNEEAGRDPQSKVSLAAARREARAARRNRDRFVRRRTRLMDALVEGGLMPSDKDERKKLEKLDPYWLRKEALDQRLEPFEVGRAIFHINQRRGFRSNRIADSKEDDKSALKQGVQSLEANIKDDGGGGEARTLGELLARRQQRDKLGNRESSDGMTQQHVRFRPATVDKKNIYEYYPTRKMIESEIDKIWNAQKDFHKEQPTSKIFTEECLAKIKRIVIEQRPLKPQIVGRCTLLPAVNESHPYGFPIDEGERTPKAHPLFQRFRILQDTCQLRVVTLGHFERPISVQERSAIIQVLLNRSTRTVSMEKLRQVLSLPENARFNYEQSGRTELQPDQTASKLASRKAFGRDWRNMSIDRQIEVVERLLALEDETKMREWLQTEFDLNQTNAEYISGLRLPQGHSSLGRRALKDLVKIMEQSSIEEFDSDTGEIIERPLKYDEAVQRMDMHHSDLKLERRSHLPYYGQALTRHVISKPEALEGSQEHVGRVSNPTVHICLNQLQKIVNLLIDEYGPPDEIVVELARELKLNKESKERLSKQNRENEKNNRKIRQELEKLGQGDTYGNRLILRLYHDLPPSERVCVYTGQCISMAMLFSGEVEIDHILPHSRTLDDSFMNKVLCTREVNRIKRGRAPEEVWAGDQLQEINERAERLFRKKSWRFMPGAMERFGDESQFIARQLTDTQYMSRLARTYLTLVCSAVRVSPGRLTAMLRSKWQLDGLLSDDKSRYKSIASLTRNEVNWVRDSALRSVLMEVIQQTDDENLSEVLANIGEKQNVQTVEITYPKNRNDHRHHAIDAFVIACTDLGLLNKISKASGRAEELDLDRLYPKNEFPEPFDNFRTALRCRLQTLIVSHRPDHGITPNSQKNCHRTSGKLLEETAYGVVEDDIDGKSYNLVTRKPIDSLTRREIDCVRDPVLRSELQNAVDGISERKELSEVLRKFGKDREVRRVRVLKTNQFYREIKHGDDKFIKAYIPEGNHRIEIYRLLDGSWKGEGITIFDANQRYFEPNWRANETGARLMMKIHSGDLIEADFGSGRQVYRVCRLEPSANRLRLAPHYEAGSLGDRHRENNEIDPFRYEIKSYSTLKKAQATMVFVDPIGRKKPE